MAPFFKTIIMANIELVEVEFTDGKKAKVYKDEVPMLEKLGKLMKRKPDDKSLKADMEDKAGEKPKRPKVMTTKKNLKGI